MLQFTLKHHSLHLNITSELCSKQLMYNVDIILDEFHTPL